MSGMVTVVQQTARPSSGQWTHLQKSSVPLSPLPSVLDTFLTWCSSNTNSIVKDPTHPSHSLFQLLPSGRRYWSIRAHSARLLSTAFSPRLWEPWTQLTRHSLKPHTHPLPPETWTIANSKTFLCNSKFATHRWVGLYKPPVVTHSPLFVSQSVSLCLLFPCPYLVSLS